MLRKIGNGKVRAFAGKRLNEFRAKLAGQNADLLVTHRHAGRDFVYRLVLIWNPLHKTHMVLATNLDAAEFAPTLVRTIYAVRWQVELAFKEWKSYANLHKFNTSKTAIVEGTIWASLAAALLKRFLAQAAQRVHDVATSTRKAAMCVGSHVVQIVKGLLGRVPPADAFAEALDFLAHNAKRDNRKRDKKDGRLAAGLEEVMQHAILST